MKAAPDSWEWLVLDAVVPWAWNEPFLLSGLPPSLCVQTGTNRDKCDSRLPQPWRGRGLKGRGCMCFMGVEALPVVIIVRRRIELHDLLVGKRRKVREKRV